MLARDLLKPIQAGDRRALAQAMTLVESTRENHRQQADDLLSAIQVSHDASIRIGVSGIPGVGKSTFIEAFGLYLIEQGHKVAVLAIDPTSPLTHGSILADKTRMTQLTKADNAFIRPSPSAGTLGGIAAKTREITTLCEAAGFDIILIETVGVGQSEVSVYTLADMVLLLLPPAGGDDLQGIKKGIVEIADLILVNKWDGELKESCQRAVQHYRQALRLSRSRTDMWEPMVKLISAREGTGLNQVWELIQAYCLAMKDAKVWVKRREEQRSLWLEDTLKEELWQHFKRLHAGEISQLNSNLSKTHENPVKAVHQLVHALMK